MRTAKKPAYLLHKPTGQARVRIDGKDFYLDTFGSPDSYARYEDAIRDWARKQDFSKSMITVDELVLRYCDFADGYYRKHGNATAEVDAIRLAMRPLVKLFGTMRVREFGPLKLKAVRDEMVKLGIARITVNDRVHRIKRLFRWGVENELVTGDVLTALQAVTALRRGKTTAPDLPPVQPVDDSIVEATLPHMSPIVADMIRLQRLTGMRPAEACLIRPADLDRSGEVWRYTPSEHKTEHHGKTRTIFIGPLGQAILLPYLLRAPESICFSPAEAVNKQRQARHEARRTPLGYGNRPGSNLKESPATGPGERYTSCSYRRAIERACDKAFPVPDELKSPRGVVFAKAETAKRLAAVKAFRTAHRWSPITSYVIRLQQKSGNGSDSKLPR